MKNLFKKNVWLIGILTVIFIWCLFPLTGLINSFFLPYPHRVFKDAFNLLFNDSLYMDLLITILRTIAGFILASLWGIIFGILLGYYSILNKAFGSVIDFFRSIPATALIPLALLLFTKSEIARVSIVVFSCGLIVLISTIYGVKSTTRTRKEVAFLFGATQIQIFTQIIFKEALVSIFSGLRINLSLSLILIVVGEMFIGLTTGLGMKIYNFQVMNEVSNMYAVILITGILGYLLNFLFISIEKKIIHWEKL